MVCSISRCIPTHHAIRQALNSYAKSYSISLQPQPSLHRVPQSTSFWTRFLASVSPLAQLRYLIFVPSFRPLWISDYTHDLTSPPASLLSHLLPTSPLPPPPLTNESRVALAVIVLHHVHACAAVLAGLRLAVVNVNLARVAPEAGVCTVAGELVDAVDAGAVVEAGGRLKRRWWGGGSGVKRALTLES